MGDEKKWIVGTWELVHSVNINVPKVPDHGAWN